MNEISWENKAQKTPASRLAARRWLKEAGYVALREMGALAVLALIIMSAFGWFWSDPLAFERADIVRPTASPEGDLPEPGADFGRADPVQLAAIAPGAGGNMQPVQEAAGGGADIAQQAIMPLWRRNAVATT